MAVMSSFLSESSKLQQKAQPVPSEMALDLINGNSKHLVHDYDPSPIDATVIGLNHTSNELRPPPHKTSDIMASLPSDMMNDTDDPAVADEPTVSASESTSLQGVTENSAPIDNDATDAIAPSTEQSIAQQQAPQTQSSATSQGEHSNASAQPLLSETLSNNTNDPPEPEKIAIREDDALLDASNATNSADNSETINNISPNAPASTDATSTSTNSIEPPQPATREPVLEEDGAETRGDIAQVGINQVEQDSVMMDAPASPNPKKSRERDDDQDDMQPAKRAKVETENSNSAQVNSETTSAVASPAPTTPTGHSSVTETPGSSAVSDDAQKPTDYQLKEIAKHVRNQKNSNNGRNFKDSVAKLWPTLAEQYAAKISKPIDLSIIENKVKNDEYDTIGDIKADLNLLYDNTNTFNGPEHVVTKAAAAVRDTIIGRIPSASAAKGVARPVAKAPKRSTPRAESAARAPPPKDNRRRSNGTASIPANTAAPGPAFALNPDGNPVIRRDSTKGDDRPKRQIHAPKTRDIAYNPRPKKKKYIAEMRFCDHVLGELKKPKYIGHSSPFLVPVDPVALHIPDYFKVIKNPMDVSTIEEKLQQGQYEKAKEFEDDFRLIFANCRKYNTAPDTPIRDMCKKFEQDFDIEWAKKAAYLAEQGEPVASSPQQYVSEQEEESEEEEEAQPASPEPDARVDLVNRLVVEQNNLINAMGAKKPDNVTIEMHNTMITFLKKKIDDMDKEIAKKGAGKKKAPASKGTKTAKAPASKRSKPAPPAKAYKVRNIGNAEKEIISTGISLLEDHVMIEAIKLLKVDFPDLNVEDEIEFDIDQFSAPTLSRLYDLIVKHNPQLVPDRKPKPAVQKQVAKPKKNKPMSRWEQESKIAHLKASQAQFKRSTSQDDDKSAVRQSIENEEEQSSGDDESSDSEEE